MICLQGQWLEAESNIANYLQKACFHALCKSLKICLLIVCFDLCLESVFASKAQRGFESPSFRTTGRFRRDYTKKGTQNIPFCNNKKKVLNVVICV